MKKICTNLQERICAARSVFEQLRMGFGQPQVNHKLLRGVGHGQDAHHALAAPEADVVWGRVSLHGAVAEVAAKPLLHLQTAQITVFSVSILVAAVQRLVPASNLRKNASDCCDDPRTNIAPCAATLCFSRKITNLGVK
jgi:hypothetical protein